MAGRTGLKKLLTLLAGLPPPSYSVPLSVRKFPVFLSASSLTKPESEVSGVGEFVEVVLILENIKMRITISNLRHGRWERRCGLNIFFLTILRRRNKKPEAEVGAVTEGEGADDWLRKFNDQSCSKVMAATACTVVPDGLEL